MRRNQKAWVIQTFCSLPKGSNSNQKTAPPPRPRKGFVRDKQRDYRRVKKKPGMERMEERVSRSICHRQSKQTMSGVTTGPPCSTNRRSQVSLAMECGQFFLQYQTRKSTYTCICGCWDFPELVWRSFLERQAIRRRLKLISDNRVLVKQTPHTHTPLPPISDSLLGGRSSFGTHWLRAQTLKPDSLWLRCHDCPSHCVTLHNSPSPSLSLQSVKWG